ncbi:MAG: DNA polymerase III subunit delta [Candidatus Dormibacteria bacterium]
MEPLVLVHGDDPYLVSSCGLRLRAQLGADVIADLGLEEFRGARDLDAIARSLATPPFLALRRLVVIWDPPQVAAGQRSPKDAGELGALLGGRLETTAALVVNRGVLPATSPLLRAVRDHLGEVRLMRRPRGGELRSYVDQAVREKQLRLGQPVRARLVEVAAQDLGQFHQELEKLELFGLGSPSISDAEGLQLVTSSPPTELYRLTDALFEAPGRVGARLSEIAGRSDLPPPVVVGALARVFRDLISFADGRGSALPDWRQEKLRAHLRRAGEPRLRRWLVELADLDWSTRTGAIDGQEGLDLLLAGMATQLGS